MTLQLLPQLETDFFRALNQFAEPLIRLGFGNPLLWPTGTIVIETTGRKSGRQFNVPVLATRIGSLIVFSTVRCRSQWVQNLAANPEVRYWLGGKAREATALIITPGTEALSPKQSHNQTGAFPSTSLASSKCQAFAPQPL